MYSKPDGLVWCGTTEEWRGFDNRSLEATRNNLVEWADAVLPGVGQGELVLHTACLRPVTPDWLPIIGKMPGYENLAVVTGAGKKGILLGPGMAKPPPTPSPPELPICQWMNSARSGLSSLLGDLFPGLMWFQRRALEFTSAPALGRGRPTHRHPHRTWNPDPLLSYPTPPSSPPHQESTPR